MKQLSLTVFAIIAILLALFGYAATPASMAVPGYSNAACQDYTGTWRGFITDPTDLFGNGGAWPITISLYQTEGHLIGQSTAVRYADKNGSLPVKKIWADCKDGVLSQIVWGEKGECGGFSQQGMLVSRNVLMLQLNWESAMAGTTFIAFLQRENAKYPYKIPSGKDAFVYGKRETCH